MWELAGDKPRRSTYNLDLPLKQNILKILAPLSHVLTCLVNKYGANICINNNYWVVGSYLRTYKEMWDYRKPEQFTIAKTKRGNNSPMH